MIHVVDNSWQIGGYVGLLTAILGMTYKYIRMEGFELLPSTIQRAHGTLFYWKPNEPSRWKKEYVLSEKDNSTVEVRG